jgi:hypothetical protein
MSVADFLPLTTYHEFPPLEMANRARPFRDEMLRRRTVRQFSNPEVKSKIRAAAEEEERRFYSGRAPQEWLMRLRLSGQTKTSLISKPLLSSSSSSQGITKLRRVVVS